MLIVVARGHGPVALDAGVATFATAHREPWLTSVFEALTWLGSTAILAPVVVAVGVWRRRRGASWRPLVLPAASLAGAFGLSQLVKHAVARPRPDDRLVHVVGYAFPSGHATCAAAGWLAVAIALGDVLPARRRALVAAALVVIAIVGASRVYLHVHWATDVVGGWALGGLWFALVLLASRRGHGSAGSSRLERPAA